MAHQSEQLNELFSALAKAQAEITIASMSSNNPFFKSKYADLAEIVKSSRPSLTKHGLSVIQQILYEEGHNFLVTVLGHSSGQWIASRVIIVPVKNDPQSLGSCITYLKRYSYAALIGVVTSDEDDDGESAVRPAYTPSVRQQPLPETITPEQRDMLLEELNGHPDIAVEIFNVKKINSIAELKKTDFSSVLAQVRKIKKELA